MVELFDEDGNAVEAFTQEDIDTKLEETKKEYDGKVSGLEEELQKEKEKEKNFSKLREQKKELSDDEKKKQEESHDKIADLEKRIEEAENAGISRVVGAQRDAIIRELADGDEELEKRMVENYKVINKPESNPQEIALRAKDAYLLSLDREDMGSEGVINPPSGQGRAVGGGEGANVDSELKDIGKKFKISDKDWSQYLKNK